MLCLHIFMGCAQTTVNKCFSQIIVTVTALNRVNLKKDASNFFASVGTRQRFSKDQDADDVHDQLAMKAFSTIKTNEMYRKIKFCGVQSDTLDFIFSNKTDSSTRTSSNATTNHDQLLRGDISNASTHEIASNLKAAQLPQTSSSSVKCNLKQDRYRKFVSLRTDAMSYIKKRKLSTS